MIILTFQQLLLFIAIYISVDFFVYYTSKSVLIQRVILNDIVFQIYMINTDVKMQAETV